MSNVGDIQAAGVTKRRRITYQAHTQLGQLLSPLGTISSREISNSREQQQQRRQQPRPTTHIGMRPHQHGRQQIQTSARMAGARSTMRWLSAGPFAQTKIATGLAPTRGHTSASSALERMPQSIATAVLVTSSTHRSRLPCRRKGRVRTKAKARNARRARTAREGRNFERLLRPKGSLWRMTPLDWQPRG